MAILPPSYREKRRYVLVEYDKDLNFFYNYLKNKYVEYFGLFGLARAGIMVKKISDGLFLIKVNRKYVNNLLFVLYSIGITKNFIGIFKTMKQAIKYLENKNIKIDNNK